MSNFGVISKINFLLVLALFSGDLTLWVSGGVVMPTLVSYFCKLTESALTYSLTTVYCRIHERNECFPQ